MKKSFKIGIDIGGTNTVFGFIDEKGEYLYGNTIATHAENNVEDFVLRLVESIKETSKKKINGSELLGIGVAAPSANYYSGIIEVPSNLNWRYVNFVDLLKEHFEIPIKITNDANAAALGEKFFGVAKDMKNFVMLTLGTGLGSGIVLDGEILHGENGQAGELGHMVVNPDGRSCSCGKSGCLETYISANGLKRTVFDLLSKFNIKSELRDISYNDLTAEKISLAANAGDPIAIKTFEFTGKVLGNFLANICSCFDPQAFILFGGIAEVGDILLKPTVKSFEDNILEVYKGKVKILKSELQNGKAAVLGASSLIAN